MTRRILICGATGFIGRNLAETWVAREGVNVTGVYHKRPPYDLPGLAWVQADLTRGEDVARVVPGMDVVLQAAATTSGAKEIVHNPAYHVTDNAVMNALLFRACHEQAVGHVLFFSCTTLYPSAERPLRETDFDANAEITPAYFGGAWTKVYNERMCAFYARQGRGRWTVLRHSNIYGPYDKYDLERSHVFGATVTKVMTAAEDEPIVVWGDGGQGRDLLHVADLCRAVDAALDRQPEAFGLYNVGCGHAVTVRDLVARIIRLSGRDLTITYDRSKPTISTSLCLDCARAREELGWTPRIDLDAGIKRTLAWYRQAGPGVTAGGGR